MNVDNLKNIQKEWHGSLKSYLIGFFLCILITAASFGLAITRALPMPYLIYTLGGLAIVQAIIQLLFFLHLGQEDKPKWETLIFAFMVLILFIIVIGTLWIMYDLDLRVMGGMMGENTSHD